MEAAVAVVGGRISIDAVIGIDHDRDIARAVGNDGLEGHVVAVGQKSIAIGARHRVFQPLGLAVA